MLSRDLRSLKGWFDTLLDGDQELTADGAQAFSSELAEAVEKAQALEATPVPLHQKRSATDLGGNVVMWPVIPKSRPGDQP